ncbi:MAG: protein kinase [Myxococcales bacterium]|nr:protein kinase [Myxococcales bacterium]
MRCPRCDHVLPDGDRFCGRCGLSRSDDGIPVDPLLGITVAERYRIERRIGVGGMGTVYLGVHTRIGQKVAIKVLHERYAGDAQLTLRFENEALTYGQVTHPNLVNLHDYGRTHDGTFFMVLEYCPGISLAQLLRQEKRLEPPQATDIILQVAQGLGAAHAAGIVHRDLKPENVILTETRPGRYHARLLDFGIAKRLDDDGPRLTQAGMVFGTPEYMAPEQARGETVDARSDVYALGCVFYELLTGKPPFTGSNKMNVMHRQASEVPPPPSFKLDTEVPGAIETAVMRCLEKRPDDRFPDAATLIEALDGALGADRLTPMPLAPAAAAPATEAPSATSAPQVSSEDDSRAADSAPFQLGGAAPAAADPLERSFVDTPPGLRGLGDPAVLRTGPSGRALAAAAALFFGAVALASWLFSADPASPSAPAAVAEAPPPAPTPPSVKPPAAPTPEVKVAAPAPKPAKVAEAAPTKRAPAKRAPAKRAPAIAAAPKPKPEAAPAPEPPPAKPAPAKPAKPVIVVEDDPKPAPAEKPAKVAEKPAKPAEKVAEAKPAPPKPDPAKARAERLEKARKALRQGAFSDAVAAADAVLAEAPGDDDALSLKKQVNEVRQKIALGRVAFDGADCVGAIQALEPVLEASPGAKGVSHMVNSCRNALPPRQL